jgi:hypothetical protein
MLGGNNAFLALKNSGFCEQNAVHVCASYGFKNTQVLFFAANRINQLVCLLWSMT